MEKLRFKDGKTYDITGATATSITFSASITDFEAIHAECTKSNMQVMTILDSAGTTVLSAMKNYKPTGIATITDTDTSVDISVGIAEMSDLEVAALENAEAIAELAALIAATE